MDAAVVRSNDVGFEVVVVVGVGPKSELFCGDEGSDCEASFEFV